MDVKNKRSIYKCNDKHNFNRLKSLLRYRDIEFKIVKHFLILKSKFPDFDKINKCGITEKKGYVLIDSLGNDFYFYDSFIENLTS